MPTIEQSWTKNQLKTLILGVFNAKKVLTFLHVCNNLYICTQTEAQAKGITCIMFNFMLMSREKLSKILNLESMSQYWCTYLPNCNMVRVEIDLAPFPYVQMEDYGLYKLDDFIIAWVKQFGCVPDIKDATDLVKKKIGYAKKYLNAADYKI